VEASAAPVVLDEPQAARARAKEKRKKRTMGSSLGIPRA